MRRHFFGAFARLGLVFCVAFWAVAGPATQAEGAATAWSVFVEDVQGRRQCWAVTGAARAPETLFYFSKMRGSRPVDIRIRLVPAPRAASRLALIVGDETFPLRTEVRDRDAWAMVRGRPGGRTVAEAVRAVERA